MREDTADKSQTTEIHPTAIVQPGAELGEGVWIGPYTLIGPKVVLGDRVKVGPHAVIEGRTRIGSDSQVHSFATIGIIPQDLKYRGEDTELIIGERNALREYVNISIGTDGGGGKTVLGSDNLIMSFCHIAHDCILGDHVIMASGATLAGHVVIADRGFVGGLAAIHQFCRIGSLAMIAGGSMVVQDVPPYCMVQGDRATVSGLNVVGLKRQDLKSERVNEIKTMFRLLYKENLTVADAVSRIEAEVPVSPERGVFVEFLKASHRGVVR